MAQREGQIDSKSETDGAETERQMAQRESERARVRRRERAKEQE
jgi:hypothetical protein